MMSDLLAAYLYDMAEQGESDVIAVDYVRTCAEERESLPNSAMVIRGILQGVTEDLAVVSVLSLAGNDDEVSPSHVVRAWHRGQLVTDEILSGAARERVQR